MNKNTSDLGRHSEELAVSFLEQHQYKILDKNFRSKFGEIDIIAQDREYLCFVEVRAKLTPEYGHPLESITETKRKRIIKTAQIYLYEKQKKDCFCRFDVVSVVPEGDNKFALEIIKNAFEM